MTEYIDKAAAVAAVMATEWYDGTDGAMAMEIVARQPAADVEPVVNAHWIPKKEMVRSPFARNYVCSHCGHEPLEVGERCPHCGAHMDEGVAQK